MLAKRRVIVTVSASGVTGVTVDITRDCLAVVCPAAGGDGSATECLKGHCVSPACSAEHPELCGDAVCMADEDCAGTGSMCATTRCTMNACLDTPNSGACGADQICLPAGCVPRPGMDAAVDAAVDGGCVESAPCDTGGACETGEMRCAGATPACVAVGVEAAGTACRPSAGECDVEETCDGTAPSCPSNAVVAPVPRAGAASATPACAEPATSVRAVTRATRARRATSYATLHRPLAKRTASSTRAHPVARRPAPATWLRLAMAHHPCVPPTA